jgi:hypothetical protein
MIPTPGVPQVEFPSTRRAVRRFGYSCQYYVGLEIAKSVFNVAVPYIWFTTYFNAVMNVESSNPREIYAGLSSAVQRKDVNHQAIKGRRASLIEILDTHLKRVNLQRWSTLRNQVLLAPIAYFRPQVWLLDLETTAKNRQRTVEDFLQECRNHARRSLTAPGQVLQPDEYLIPDLLPQEYTVIIEG